MIRLPRIRFSVRTLLGGTFLVAAVLTVLTWFSVAYVQRYRKDAETVEDAVSTGGKVHSTAREPRWLWEQFGDDVARRGASLVLSETDVSDAQVAQLERLHDLGGLYLDRTAVSNDGLVCLAEMPDLIALSLRRTDVTELPSLSHMSKLVDLDLAFTEVEDVDLTDLDSLEKLGLRATRVNDADLKQLPPLPNLRSLDVAGAPGQPMAISDQGIASITSQKFPQLKTIYLYDCDISDAEVERLKSEFPGLQLYR